ncbi:r3h domain [Akkermansia glycaniphila]|uniref:R3h domain n=2 Tax=Akkermansia glycaniphila TaxID=1679444 RepID=A0A1C7PB49_9BACT|nr:hypothetical protein AC781_08390 [Akkermansia glycaniphila]SEH75917.1 r3h domain [Akkermansia glycaniphila]
MDLIEVAKKSLGDILNAMGFAYDVDVTEEDGVVCLQIASEDARFLIGEDGDRLDDLQYLVNRMIQNVLPDAPRVKVDCDHYREKSEERLLGKARSLAERVLESGEEQKMPPLNAYHRRLVHNALKEIEGVVTVSEDGDDRYKRITIRRV